MTRCRVDINTLHSEASKGDPKAVEELFVILSSRFRMFAHHRIRNKTDAEEVVQEALMTIYKEYGHVTFTTSFSAWACKVLDNRVLNYFRKKQRESQRIEPENDSTVDSTKSPTGINPDLRRKLLDCLRKVCQSNIRYARILNLHYLGYKTDEISVRMNVRPPTLYSALSKARTMLETCLEMGDTKT
jgi:RNA polymerase sigma-70 factor (ECF subfamily)